MMSSNYYAFPFDQAIRDQGYATWLDAFTKEELQKIIDIGEHLRPHPAEVGNAGNVDKDIRDSHVSWIEPAPQVQWIFDRVCGAARSLNTQVFGYDLTGVQALQYTVYDEQNSMEPQHYDWHIDRMGVPANSKPPYNLPRKLSMSLQLSDPMDYVGGEIWLWGLHREVMSKRKGMMVMFPSYTLHQVTPVTKGRRSSLVAWFTGPELK